MLVVIVEYITYCIVIGPNPAPAPIPSTFAPTPLSSPPSTSTTTRPPVFSQSSTSTKPPPVWPSAPYTDPYTTTSRPPWVWSPQPIKTTHHPGPVAPVPSLWRPSGSSGPNLSPSWKPSPASSPYGESVWGPSPDSNSAGSSLSPGPLDPQPGSSAFPSVCSHFHSWTFVICLFSFVMRFTTKFDFSFFYSVPFREFLLCHIIEFCCQGSR